MADMQQTVREIIRFSGVGLHTGSHVNVRVCPADDDTGIVFIRKDIPGCLPIKAEALNVVATTYATTLGFEKGVTVSTVEHLLAAFYGLGVDNAIVELDGPEVPILDGSASSFIEMIEDAGLKELDCPRRRLVIKKPVKVSDGEKFAILLPSEGTDLRIDYTIDFSHPFLSRQSFATLFGRDAFKSEVGSARTFGFLKDVEMLKANGLARGGSLDNAIVISDTEILNEGGLRYPDEFVRHKVLDMMGDLSLIGAPVSGHLIAHRSGHALNHKLVRSVLKTPGAWEIRSAQRAGSVNRFRPPFMEKAAAV